MNEENCDLAVSFEDQEVLTNNLAVPGSTGSSESFFVKKHLTRALGQLRHAESPFRMVLIDTHGEYRDLEGLHAEETLAGRDEISRAQAAEIAAVEDLRQEFSAVTRADEPFPEGASRVPKRRPALRSPKSSIGCFAKKSNAARGQEASERPDQCGWMAVRAGQSGNLIRCKRRRQREDTRIARGQDHQGP